MTKRLTILYTLVAMLSACAIRNDIPYPVVEGTITAFETEGMRGETVGNATQATINAKTRTVTLYVDDSVDLQKLKITKLTLSANTRLKADSTVCVDFGMFPTMGFESLDDLPLSANTRMDFTKPVKFTLSTYQDYEWTVNVTQVIDRTIELENQVGKPIIDLQSRRVIVYVAKNQPINQIAVTTFDLGGVHGTVDPDPTQFDTFDFSGPRQFYVSYSWEEVAYPWTVYVYNMVDDTPATSSTAFAMTTRAIVSGSIQNGKTPVVEYKKQGSASWSRLAASNVAVKGTSFTAEIKKLTPATTYSYRVNVDDQEGEEQQFTLSPATPLTNGSLDDWTLVNDKRWDPCAENDVDFWGTGNAGSASFIGNITEPYTDEVVKGKAAKLQTKWALIKLAAGNIFTGDFQLDGLNGLLHFGRPFSAFPSALKFYYQYSMMPIDKLGDNLPEFLANSKGQPDTCQVFIALTDNAEPTEIRNNPNNRKLFDRNDPGILAFAEFTSGNSTKGGYQEVILPLEYRATNRTPKWLIVVASSSKYGDYYVGGVGSTMLLDELELLYE